jgi:cobalt-zinc-cadmium efflux system protein
METHNHSHTHSHLREAARQTTTRLTWSLGITLAFVIFEAAAGYFANSLALLTDAAHNLTDVIALGLSWFAIRITAQPANAQKTYGYHRAGILVALLNSTTLILISLGIFYEAYKRFMSPPEVQSGVLIVVGLIAVVINLVTALLVHRGSESDLNLRSAFVHLMGDVLSTIGAVIAGIIIYFTGANWLDPFVSVLIGILILYNAWGILRDAVDILLESTPRDVDMKKMVGEITQLEGVLGVHDLHVWSITQNLRTMSAHILTEDISVSAGAEIQNRINELVYHRYNIAHATLQLECVDCGPDGLYCRI